MLTTNQNKARAAILNSDTAEFGWEKLSRIKRGYIMTKRSITQKDIKTFNVYAA